MMRKNTAQVSRFSRISADTMAALIKVDRVTATGESRDSMIAALAKMIELKEAEIRGLEAAKITTNQRKRIEISVQLVNRRNEHRALWMLQGRLTSGKIKVNRIGSNCSMHRDFTERALAGELSSQEWFREILTVVRDMEDKAALSADYCLYLQMLDDLSAHDPDAALEDDLITVSARTDAGHRAILRRAVTKEARELQAAVVASHAKFKREKDQKKKTEFGRQLDILITERSKLDELIKMMNIDLSAHDVEQIQ